MTVKLIKTLGASPLVLLEKLAAAGGCTLVQDKKVSDVNGNSFVYKVIAKISDNLYIEALDAVYNCLNTNTSATPCENGTLTSFLAQEATEADKVAYNGNRDVITKLGTLSDSVFTSLLGKHSISVLVALPISVETVTQGDYTGGADFYDYGSALISKIVTTGELNSGEALAYGRFERSDRGFVLTGDTRSPDTAWPFGILSTPFQEINITTNCLFYVNGYSYSKNPKALVVSGANMRLATAVDINGELLSPTNWSDLPIFTDVMSDGAGLYFSVPGTKGQYLVVATVDTSKGNKLSGTFPVIYRNTPYAKNTNALAETGLKVIGDATAATTETTMNEYVPTLPIANDSVTGGPVVTNIFAVGTDEIRGVVPGVLGCSSNLSIGTVGYLDGIKYKVVKTGRMIKIG